MNNKASEAIISKLPGDRKKQKQSLSGKQILQEDEFDHFHHIKPIENVAGIFQPPHQTTQLNKIDEKSVQTKISPTPNQQIIGVCNGLFVALTQKCWLLDKFIFEKQEKDIEAATCKKKSYLADYLQKIHERKTSQTPFLYKKTLNEIKIMVEEKMESIWNSFSQRERNEYEQIAQNLRSRYLRAKQMTKFYHPQMKARDMFKFDVMSHFMRRNRQYQRYCVKSIMRSIISKKTMQTFFCQPKLYVQCWDKFADFQEWIYYEYQSEFQELITITSIVELKYRILNNQGRGSKEKLQENIIKIKSLEFQKRLQQLSEDENQKAFKFKFCELAFSIFGYPFTQKAAGIRAQISMKLSKISENDSLLEQNRQFLNIKYDYAVSLSTLKAEYDNIKNSQPAKTSNRLTISESSLNQVEWLHLGSQRLPNEYNQITTGNSSEFCSFQKIIMKKTCEIGLKRVKLLDNVANIHLKLEKSLGKKPLYISSFQYSYRELIKHKNKDTNQTDFMIPKDLVEEVIIGFTGTSCLFIATIKKQLDYYTYSKFLQKIFKQFNKKQLTIILYEFNATKKIPWQSYISLSHFFKEELNSNVYVSANQELFKNHIDIFLFIYSSLMRNHFSPENFYEAFEKIVHKVARKFEKYETRMQNQRQKEVNSQDKV